MRVLIAAPVDEPLMAMQGFADVLRAGHEPQAPHWADIVGRLQFKDSAAFLATENPLTLAVDVLSSFDAWGVFADAIWVPSGIKLDRVDWATTLRNRWMVPIVRYADELSAAKEYNDGPIETPMLVSMGFERNSRTAFVYDVRDKPNLRFTIDVNGEGTTLTDKTQYYFGHGPLTETFFGDRVPLFMRPDRVGGLSRFMRYLYADVPAHALPPTKNAAEVEAVVPAKERVQRVHRKKRG